MNAHTPRPAAKKSLGQHFLKHEHICRRIAELVLPQPQDRLLEIGPGPGALTRALEEQPHSRLLLLEKDRYWAVERQRLAGPHTQAVLMDALRFPWFRISPANPWKIAGNLPYNVASPMLWDMVAQARGMVRGVFMVQKEVGQRLAAQPGSGQYGALSVWVQSFVQPRLEFVVGPGAFSPPPKVDSAVLSFMPQDDAARPVHTAHLSRLLKLCFQQRRKQLGGIVRRCGQPALEAALEDSGIGPSLRPEQLAVTDFHRLASLWACQEQPRM
ncbi:16S rRNA (adenine(1518)-N(6)/adenine(1519)-N(6))-dimethyltransferase RsmA [uncultured Desulfovibrio sp.]|uniref:16S rRNA (adenine(1518)-N(6)/adenine(1519)-N(6))- dimethyltransferase RsmA n=1 Tax=uncultured Desulfovibrio sp. TaxID=167968 RepID=UPI00261F0AE9|nr:16S rRNA (adenine(1518)-N(6)/adenine(1519)-N(6))-dimethyltransferase RsmA [uncultured Desulfovibrio sp.]